MQIEYKIRKLARSFYWQRSYSLSKSCGFASLFENNKRFSGLQILFLYWLDIYSILFLELAQKDWENLDKEVIEDNVRCDAFLYWRQRQQDKINLENRKNLKSSKRRKPAKKHEESFRIYNGKNE